MRKVREQSSNLTTRLAYYSYSIKLNKKMRKLIAKQNKNIAHPKIQMFQLPISEETDRSAEISISNSKLKKQNKLL